MHAFNLAHSMFFPPHVSFPLTSCFFPPSFYVSYFLQYMEPSSSTVYGTLTEFVEGHKEIFIHP